jgi:predicted RNase H-like HicB family nuclease
MSERNYSAYCPDLPGVATAGATEEEITSLFSAMLLPEPDHIE